MQELKKTQNSILDFIISEVEHGYASSLPGPFVLEESYTQIKNQISNGMPSMINSKRLKNSNNKKPQGNR